MPQSNRFSRLVLKIMAAALVTLTPALFAQDGGRAVVRTTGHLDADGTATYSVFLATQGEEIGELTIAAEVPRGTRFLAAVHNPESAVFNGVQKDVVYWYVGKVAKDTLLGPFVFKVKSDGGAAEFPATIAALVAFQKPTPETVMGPPAEGKLTPLAEAGSLIVDQRGTLDAAGKNAPAFLGGTGVLIYVPEGAVDRAVTLSVRRLPVVDEKLPKTDEPTWWCALYQFNSSPQVSFSKPIGLSVPTRRPITPGLAVSMFSTPGISEWTKGSAGKTSEQRSLGFGGFGPAGSCGSFQQFGGGGFGQATCGFGSGFGFGGFGAFGYVEQDNLRSSVTGASLSTSGVPSAARALLTPPSIVAILIGLR